METTQKQEIKSADTANKSSEKKETGKFIPPSQGLQEREPLLQVVVGKKGVGKTHRTKSLMTDYIQGNMQLGIKPRKVIILDVNNEFQNIKRIACTPTSIALFSLQRTVQARRVSPMKSDGTKKTLDELAVDLKTILDNFKGGMVLVEDINKYVSDNLKGDLIGSICTQRHVDCDIIIHFQGIGRAGQPKIKANMNLLRFHKVSDSVKRHEKKFEDDSEILMIAENIVNRRYEAGDIRFYLYVNFDNKKITGKFNKGEAMLAIEDYIMSNENMTIKPVLNKKDVSTGKPLYDYPTAYKIVSDKILKDYFTFKSTESSN